MSWTGIRVTLSKGLLKFQPAFVRKINCCRHSGGYNFWSKFRTFQLLFKGKTIISQCLEKYSLITSNIYFLIFVIIRILTLILHKIVEGWKYNCYVVYFTSVSTVHLTFISIFCMKFNALPATIESLMSVMEKCCKCVKAKCNLWREG